VNTSDEEDVGRPSNLEGIQKSFRFSTLKRAAEDDGAGPSGITTDIVNRSTDTSQSQGIVTYNKFACLSQEEIIDNDDDTQSQPQGTSRTHPYIRETRRKRFAKDPETETGTDTATHTSTTDQTKILRERKPPPIYLTSKVKDYIQFSKTLKDSIGDNFNLKFLGEQIKIQFHKVKDFVDFKKFAIEMKYAFHTYSLPNEKSITVTLKGLPNIPNLSIQEELANLGIAVNSCTQINKEHSLYATYKINLSAKHTLTQLRKIRFLFYSRIYWEKYINPKKVLQCYRCQAFGHTSANCFKKPRCVKCAQPHLTSECAKSPDTPAKCCNCSGDHPSSYTQCPAYIRFLEKRTQLTSRDNFNDSHIGNAINRNLQITNPNNVKRNSQTYKGSSDTRFNPLTSTEKIVNIGEKRQTLPTKSYATMLNNNNNNSFLNDDISNFNGLMFEINRLKRLVNIPHFFSVIRNLNNRLINCKDGMEKLQAFIEASELIDSNG